MPKTKKHDVNQLSLLEKQVEDKKPSVSNPLISDGRNLKIKKPYLLSLSKYNDYLKKEWQKEEHLAYDNLLLRTMFGGIENSRDTPPEIFSGLNALEICLLETGIFKRKYIYFEDMYTKSIKGDTFVQSRKIRRNPSLYDKESRIKYKGHLDNKSLYEIVNYVLNATDVNKIYNSYKKEWEMISRISSPSKDQKEFRELNPYDPLTLKGRMDYIEQNYPKAVEGFKKALAQPFIPEKKVIGKDELGHPIIKNPEGFLAPGCTYKRGVKGMAFYRLEEYAKQVGSYIQNKEKEIQNKRIAIIKNEACN